MRDGYYNWKWLKELKIEETRIVYIGDHAFLFSGNDLIKYLDIEEIEAIRKQKHDQ